MAALANNVAVGMMDPAYFVGKRMILEWLNDVCCLNLAKIEQTASGAVALQVFDAMFPGSVPMQKVNWGAKSDYEYVQNYKILQAVFLKVKVDKTVPVDRLVRARYQDNLEFMQWLMKFYEINCPPDITAYDAVGRRAKGKGVNQFKPAQGIARKAPTGKTISARTPIDKSPAKAASDSRSRGSSTIREKENSHGLNKSASTTTVGIRISKKTAELEEKAKNLEDTVSKLKKDNLELDEEMQGMERERDFYFNKLRQVEIFLQNYEGQDMELVKNILKLLYATEDDVDGEAALAAAEAAIAASQQAREAKNADAETETEQKHDVEESNEDEAALVEEEQNNEGEEEEDDVETH
mmetsp:Transcript_33011/g.40526  ORF Transcript_33011/g.40526 Transcript_33011/m.40526 type:complete len:353 (+) Transcript_33011:295-1353(+)